MGFPDVPRNIQGTGGKLELGWKKATDENQKQGKRKKIAAMDSSSRKRTLSSVK